MHHQQVILGGFGAGRIRDTDLEMELAMGDSDICRFYLRADNIRLNRILLLDFICDPPLQFPY
ncbi:uncharacterized protein Dvar_24200 [Desulfosarcina variabilis str. Montpellier]